MKKIGMFVSLALFCGVSHALPAFMSYNIPIIPGQKIGKISIGQSRQTAIAEMGNPDSTRMYSSAVTEDRWQAKEVKGTFDRGPAVTKVMYKDGVVIQVEVTSGLYSTYQGVSTGDTFEDVRKIHSNLQVRAFRYDTGGNPFVFYYYDDLKRGIAFRKNVASTVTNNSMPDSILITRAGVASVPDLGGVSVKPVLDKTFKPAAPKPRRLVTARLNARQRRAAQNALGAVRRLESVVRIGLTYADYQERVVNAQVVVDENLRGVPKSDLRNELQAAMQAYVAARSAWSLNNQAPFAEEIFGSLLQDSWAKASRHIRNSEKLLR